MSGGDGSLVGLFAVEAGRRVAALADGLAAESPDYRTLAREAHTLRGAAAVSGLDEIAAAAEQLEAAFALGAAGAAVDGDAASALVERVRTLVDSLPAAAVEASSRAEPDDEESLVLHVEDSDVNARFVEDVLGQRPGLALVTAASGEEACRLAAARPPALVLLDLNLPDMTGEEVVERLRGATATSGVPVAVVTGGAEEERLQALRERGVRWVLLKPYGPDVLVAVVEEALARTR